jgi:hypothetical protein
VSGKVASYPDHHVAIDNHCLRVPPWRKHRPMSGHFAAESAKLILAHVWPSDHGRDSRSSGGRRIELRRPICQSGVVPGSCSGRAIEWPTSLPYSLDEKGMTGYIIIE